jgi:hypothetical protein
VEWTWDWRFLRKLPYRSNTNNTSSTIYLVPVLPVGVVAPLLAVRDPRSRPPSLLELVDEAEKLERMALAVERATSVGAGKARAQEYRELNRYLVIEGPRDLVDSVKRGCYLPGSCQYQGKI